MDEKNDSANLVQDMNKIMDPYLINLPLFDCFPINFENFGTYCVLPPYKNEVLTFMSKI